MAKALSYKKTITEKVTIKGTLNADATTVTDENDNEYSIQEYLNKFADGYVEINIGTKSEEDLTDDGSEE